VINGNGFPSAFASFKRWLDGAGFGDPMRAGH